MNITLIENGKSPDEPYNISLSFWLPPDSPYGNFQLKFMKIIQRLDEANRQIINSYNFWRNCRAGGMLPIGALERHVYANEQAIYMMRRTADELVSLIWCLSEYEKTQEYPKKIKVDCLGEVIEQTSEARLDVFSKHIELMKILNEVANAFKHSFINSDHTFIGVNEPIVHALALNRNNLNSEPKFYEVSLASLIINYTKFYKDCISWLKIYSEKNR